MEGRPTAFVASSTEHIEIAQMVQESLERDVQVTVWSQDVVRPSSYVLDELIARIDDFDFGIFVFSPDDSAVIRGTAQTAVRDNVVFELGLFAGRLGRERTFVVMPSDATNMRIASDLLGLTTVRYDSTRDDQNLSAALGSASNKIAREIKAKGIRADRKLRQEETRRRAEASRARIAALPAAEKILLEKPIGTSCFVVINDDICQASAELIVSSDDNHFTARGGVSKAILTKLGPYVRQQLDYFERKEFRQGHIVVTTGGDWDRRAVIHAAVIDLDENRYPTEESIRLVTRRILNCAVALGARTIALPVLGGGYATKYINSLGAVNAVSSEIVNFLERHSGELDELRRVFLYIYDRADADGLAASVKELDSHEAARLGARSVRIGSEPRPE
jgi:O-acetyl-ADP-ribose deacetylase (regulator of RNase III)